ncbi:MAG: InlB B-repeat-containing protein [Candidatus Natronoplasma sp.]
MKKRVMIFLVVLISMVLFVSSTATLFSSARLDDTEKEKDNDLDVETPLQAEGDDVPTWTIGSSWTYFHQLWMNDSESGDYIYLEEEFTYTVAGIEYFELNESTYLAYNLTLEGEIQDGEGEVEGYSVEVNEGTVDGYKICKVSDHAVVEDRQFRYIDATAQDIIGVDVWLDLNRSYNPPLEQYDFPVSEEDQFWANTSLRTWGQYVYDAGSIGDGKDTFDDYVVYESEGTIPYKENISVPAGDFEAYYINHTVDDGEFGYSDRWYDPGVKSYVKDVQQSGSMEDQDLKMKQTLLDYNVPEASNQLSVEPAEQWVRDDVTLSGQFPGYADEEVTIRLPQGAEPESEWVTTTDGDGNFDLTIEVPLAEDMTVTSDEFASVGFVAEIGEPGTEGYEYAVSTLCILHDNTPIYPDPADGAEEVDPNPELSVLIGHDKGWSMNVTFYDASDDSEIGTAVNVSSLDYATTTWEGLDTGTTYEWYAVADDDVNTYESDVWSFTTKTDEAEYFQVEITSPEQGEGFIGGEQIPVNYTVENTGGEAGEQDIEFYIDGTLVETEPGVNLGPGDTYDGSFIWDTTGEQPGSYDLLVSSSDDDDQVTVTILEEGIFSVNIGDYDEEVSEGEEVTVSYTVTNTGNESTQTIEFTVDGTLEDSVEITLGAGEEHQGEFTWTAGAPADYTLAVASEDDEDEVVVTVVEQVVTFELTIDSTEGGEVIEPGEGTFEYEEGVNVNIEADAEEGYEFVEWTGDVGGVGDVTANATTVEMNDNYTITAEFSEEGAYYELTVNIEGEGDVDIEPDQDQYEEGTEVTLTAVPDEGWRFVEWTGDADGESEETSVIMDEDKEITANFEEIYYTLNIEVDGKGNVSRDPGQEEYEEGTEVELTVNPQSDWFFSEWSGDVPEGEEENEVITITMDADKNLTVHFLQEAFFEVEIVDYDEEVSEGDELVVECTVTNTGDVEDTQTIELTVSDEDDNLIYDDSKEITLSAGEERTETFTWKTDKRGEFELTVWSLDDEDVVDITESVSVSVIGEDSEDGGLMDYWWLFLIAGIIIVVLVVVLATRGEEDEEKMEDEYMNEPPGATPPPPEGTTGPETPPEGEPPEKIPEPENEYGEEGYN